jgi:hypothetical protein
MIIENFGNKWKKTCQVSKNLTVSEAILLRRKGGDLNYEK